MEYFFWQNVISIHQIPFLKNLAISNNVTLIVEKKIDKIRAKQGWTIPDLDTIKLVVNPSEKEIKKIINSNFESFHFFSGFSLNKMLEFSLNQAVKNNLPNIGVILEPYNRRGFKGFLRDFKYFKYSIKYRKKIKILLVTGELGRKCYSRIGFPKKHIYDWGYFTENKNITNLDHQVREKKKLLFVGSINERKNLLGVIDVILKYTNDFEEFNIVGKGEQELKLAEAVKNTNNINLLGNISNNKVGEIMKHSDLLILPSLFDGWGAVVNEALQNGNQVLASENCGASILLDGNIRGEVFTESNKDFERVLKKWLNTKPLLTNERNEIIKWSENSISPEKVTHYFSAIINYIDTRENRESKVPIAPWL